MRFALVFAFCMALVLVVESLMGQESEDRHGLLKCKKKCKVGECCRIFWYWYQCFPQRGLGKPCRRKPPAYLCHHGCKEGLGCKRSRRPRPTGERHPNHDHKRFKCVRPPPPTQEPGSGDIAFQISKMQTLFTG